MLQEFTKVVDVYKKKTVDIKINSNNSNTNVIPIGCVLYAPYKGCPLCQIILYNYSLPMPMDNYGDLCIKVVDMY